MKLIDILVRDLHKFGGWPECATTCNRFNDEATIDFYDDEGNWPSDCSTKYGAIALECVKPRVMGERIGCETVTREQYEDALAASKPSWDGIGLPPVGMDIEYKFTKVKYRSDFSRGKVLAYGMHNVFMEHWSSKNEFIQPLDKIEFRPIRSEADKKRDEAVTAIHDEYFSHAPIDKVKDVLYALYDAIAAGKIPHIRID